MQFVADEKSKNNVITIQQIEKKHAAENSHQLHTISISHLLREAEAVMYIGGMLVDMFETWMQKELTVEKWA